MPSDAAREARVARLAAARKDSSRVKRQRALDACAALASNGIQVSFARVAREARVSTWLVYNAPGVKGAIVAAIHKQASEGLTASLERVANPASLASLRTDLALSLAENTRLRDELQRLSRRLEKQLGIEIEGASAPELTDRVTELERLNAEQSRLIAEHNAVDADQTSRVRTLELELESKDELIRSMMFAHNTATPR